MLSLKEEYVKLNAKDRLYGLQVPLVGLTGNIGSGKSTVAEFFRKKGLQVIDADKLIHNIYEREDTKELLKRLLPSAISDSGINFSLLREQFFKDTELKQELQNHLYKWLPDAFLKEIGLSATVIIYDVPLLFEKKMNDKFDFIITVSLSKEKQLKRLSERDSQSSIDTLKQIISQQLPIEEKEKGSDLVIDNGRGLEELEGQVNLALEKYFS